MEILLFIAALFMIEKLIKKIDDDGFFLKEKMRPYYHCVKRMLQPYSGSEFAKSITTTAISHFKELYKECVSYTSFDEHNMIFKIVMDESENRQIVEYYALMFIYSNLTMSSIYILTPSAEESTAKNACKNFVKKRITVLQDTIPDCFWDYFDMSKEEFDQTEGDS